jgi:adenylate cyclase
MTRHPFISLSLSCGVAAVMIGAEHLRDRVYLTPPHAATARRSLTKVERNMASVTQRLESGLYDARFKWRGRRAPHPDVAIIAITDQDLKKMGQWPWSRALHAQLIRQLEATPPKALLFDIFFIDPFTADPKGDKALAAATKANPWVVHSMFFRLNNDDEVLGMDRPMPSLLEVAHGVGYANAAIDEDGVLRRAIPYLTVEGQTMPLLSVAGYSLSRGLPWDAAKNPLPFHDARGRVLIDFAGPARSYPYYSYSDVLSGVVPPNTFLGKIVLVGSNSTGAFDHYPTPLSEFMPGLEFHANVLDNLLRGKSVRTLPMRATFLTIISLAVVCGLLFSWLSAGVGAVIVVCLGAILVGTAQWLFTYRLIMLDLGGPLLTLVLGYLAIIVYRFFSEEREKRWVKAAFDQYVSPKVLDILLADPSRLSLVGERRDMTVFFSDVAGFTSISERMNPDELVVLLNRYLSAMTEVIFHYDGYLNKYMGDGIMAFWNAPLKQADHAARACRCALRSQERLVLLNEELKSQGLNPLAARIGVNTGVMVVGNMGSVQKSDYTVMGDHVNLGSRLEGANKPYGTQLMISEFTYEVIHEQFEVRYLDRLRVPGRAKPVKTYELLSEKGKLAPQWESALPLYHEGIHLFNDRQFEAARLKFLDVLKILGQDKVCELYAQRAESFIMTPPAKEWDGVFDVKTK